MRADQRPRPLFRDRFTVGVTGYGRGNDPGELSQQEPREFPG